MSPDEAMVPPDLQTSPQRSRWLARALTAMLVAMMLIAIVPALAAVQYRFLPVLTQFEVTSAERVGSGFEMKVRLPDGESDVRKLGAGVLLYGDMVKSRIYPKWACVFRTIDASELTQNDRWRRTTIHYGVDDQPAGHSVTRSAGTQGFGPWHVSLVGEAAAEVLDSVTIRLDKQHKCFGFWRTLQRSDLMLVLPSPGQAPIATNTNKGAP